MHLVAGAAEQAGSLGQNRRLGGLGGIERADEAPGSRGLVATRHQAPWPRAASRLTSLSRGRRQGAEDPDACLRHHPPRRHTGRQRELGVPPFHIGHLAELEPPPSVGRHHPLLGHRERDPAAGRLALDPEWAQFGQSAINGSGRLTGVEVRPGPTRSRVEPGCGPAPGAPAPSSSLHRGRRQAPRPRQGDLRRPGASRSPRTG